MEQYFEYYYFLSFGPESFDFFYLTAIDMFAPLIFITYLLFEFRSNERKQESRLKSLKNYVFNSLEFLGGGYCISSLCRN